MSVQRTFSAYKRRASALGGPQGSATTIALWILLGCLGLIALIAIPYVRTVVIDEKLLITRGGRQQHRKRRRLARSLFCDEDDEPHWWRVGTGWRQFFSCVEYDLSLRRKPLGDNGVRKLVYQLSGRKYTKRDRQLRVLNLARQGITRRGAGYLARWLSLDPLSPDLFGPGNGGFVLSDAQRVPSAIDSVIYINLKGNPISVSGKEMLERAVEKARLNGIRAIVVGGGPCHDPGGSGGFVVKAGPISYSRQIIDMDPWRIPGPWWEQFRAGKSMGNWVQLIVVFLAGVIVGKLMIGQATLLGRLFPYRLAIHHRDDMVHVSRLNGHPSP